VRQAGEIGGVLVVSAAALLVALVALGLRLALT
jgi:hypothetical protein